MSFTEPVFEAVDTFGGELAVGFRHGEHQALHAFDAFLRGAHAREEFLLDVGSGEAAEFAAGNIMIFARAGRVDCADGAEFAEKFQSLAGRAQTHAGPVHDVVHGQGLGGNKKESVDFPDGLGPSEQSEEIDKHLDRLDLEIGEAGGFLPRGFKGGHGRSRETKG